MFITRIFYEIISVIIPIISSWIVKVIIDNLTFERNFEDFIVMVVFLVALQLFAMILGRISQYINGVHNEKIGNYIKVEIMRKVNSLDVSYFDNPEFYNEIQNANRDSQSLQSLTWIITTMIKGIVQSISCGIILGGLYWVFPIMIFILDIPSVLIDKKIVKKKYDWQLSKTENVRKYGYIESIIQNKAYAKDVRVFNAKDYFLNKYLKLWTAWFNEKNKIEREKITWAFISGILPYCGDIIVMIYLGMRIISGTLTIGDFTYFRSMTSQYNSGINSFLMTFNNGYESEMRLTHYSDFLKWKPNISEEGVLPLNKIETVEFRNVSFTYPFTSKEVLKDINFKINENEKIALVGVNGSGKSTLIKLLLRLYEPTKGEILINGINIKEYDATGLHDNFGVVFQDFNRYNLPLREVVALSDLSSQDDDGRIKRACDNADIPIDAGNMFTNGCETVLGKIFDKNGVVLSGGQWQKIAIAQAYFKTSNFMIMDEPNAALDPEAENRVFKKLQELSKDKSGIVITHRLSSVFIADRIIVLNNGEVEEIGTHSELILKNGIYKKLFETQAEKYQLV